MRFEPDLPPTQPRVAPERIDLRPIVLAIERQLSGDVTPDRIEDCLHTLLDTAFRDARVTTYLPIFLHRMAIESLRRESPSRHGSPP